MCCLFQQVRLRHPNYPRLRNPIWFVKKERTVSIDDRAYHTGLYRLSLQLWSQEEDKKASFTCSFKHMLSWTPVVTCKMSKWYLISHYVHWTFSVWTISIATAVLVFKLLILPTGVMIQILLPSPVKSQSVMPGNLANQKISSLWSIHQSHAYRHVSIAVMVASCQRLLKGFFRPAYLLLL
jgi:hypothetical protein